MIAAGKAIVNASAQDVRGTADRATTKPWVEVVSWRPRSFVYHNFLSAQECDHIVNISKPLMMRSTVVGAGGASVTDNIRTSYGTFIRCGALLAALCAARQGVAASSSCYQLWRLHLMR